MYSVYFDNLLQAPEDIININDVLQKSIIREDGYFSTEQIIREKSELELSFTGCSYDYIRERMRDNTCDIVSVIIKDSIGDVFYSGIINVVLCEFTPSKKIAKTVIKDTSFSAYIREYMDVELSLYNTSTKDCDNLQSPLDTFLMKNVALDNTTVISINAFDVLVTIKYLINYFTNNSIEVVSDYLSDNKYAITTGYNMHNHGSQPDEIYPSISIQNLFNELRKKLNLYMGIEYDEFGNPYLRIEQQSYFYADVELMAINEVPLSLIEEYDIKRNFSSIKAGSENFRPVEETSPITYAQNRYVAWNKESYAGCGTCASEKESILDLVSNYIIDSNVIYEALNWATGDDYGNDSSIFLFNYEVSGTSNVSKRTFFTTYYHYNESIKNAYVLENWLDYYNNCISVSRYPANGFLIKEPDYPLSITIVFPITDSCQADRIKFTDIYFDSGVNLTNFAGNILAADNLCSASGIKVVDLTYFEVPVDGVYAFKASVYNFQQQNNLGYVLHINFEVQIVTYTDSSMMTILDVYREILYDVDANTTGINLSVETGNISLQTGNCVIVGIAAQVVTVNPLFSVDYSADSIDFELIRDPDNCSNISEIDQNSKPYVINFEYPLCKSDYNTMSDNKRGYLTVGGNKYWISEVIYKPTKMSHLRLIGDNMLP